MAIVTIDEAEATLPQLIARAEAGEEIMLARGSHPVAKIVAIAPTSNKRKPGAYRGKISVGPEFFDPLPEDELNAWE